AMMAVAFDGRAKEPVLGKPVALFEDEYDLGLGVTNADYDVTPDGRFLMLRREVKSGHLRIVLNWTKELKRVLAAGGTRWAHDEHLLAGPATRRVRDPLAPRRRRHGRGLPSERHSPRPHGRDQGPARAPGPESRPARALRARGEGRLQPEPSPH